MTATRPQKYWTLGREIHYLGDIEPSLQHNTIITLHTDATRRIWVSQINHGPIDRTVRAPRGLDTRRSCNWAVSMGWILRSFLENSGKNAVTIKLE